MMEMKCTRDKKHFSSFSHICKKSDSSNFSNRIPDTFYVSIGIFGISTTIRILARFGSIFQLFPQLEFDIMVILEIEKLNQNYKHNHVL